MTITSVGYPGPIDAGEWAGLAASLGADYGVVGAGDLRVSTVPAADRTVKIAAGSAYGRGIMDVSNAEATVQLNTLVSGTRWDLVGLLRTWAGGSSATTITKVTGTTSQTAAFALRAATPGTSDFQPLALVQITAGNTVPTAVIDLRAWQANGGAVANDVLALQYLNGAGTEVWIGTDVWHRYVDGAGALQWSRTVPGPMVRVLSPSLSGGIGTNDLVSDQTVPANLFPTAKEFLRVTTSIQVLAPAGGGARLEVLVDGSVVRSATGGNGGSSTGNIALEVTYEGLLATSSAHTVRSRIVNVAGGTSVVSDLGQSFTMSVSAALDL